MARADHPLRRVPGAERDLVIVRGVEPSLRWRTFCDLRDRDRPRARVQMVLTLGALLADVPHTRPTAVTGLASDDTLVQRMGLERSHYEGPTGIVGVVHDACARANLPSVSLWASVPHYIAAAPNPKAALELVRRVEGLVGVAVDAAELERAAEEYERQVSAAVASDPDVRLRGAARGDGRRGAGGPAASAHPLGGHDRARLPALPAPARPGRPRPMRVRRSPRRR